MKTYNSLLTNLALEDKENWEDLTKHEKEMLVNAHLVSKPTVIPSETSFQKALLNILNVNLVDSSERELTENFLNARNLIFQAIKEDVEHDLEKAWYMVN